MTEPARIYLSPPHLGGSELDLLRDAVASNWITSAGPHLEAFERAFAGRIGASHAVGLASGTAAIHLAIRALDLQPEDEVLCATLTFAASANPIRYERARPVFLDAEPTTWNLDPNLLEDELARSARLGRRPKAAIVVDLYGQPASWGAIGSICERFGVPIIEDAAEALGSTYRGRPAGSFGWANVFSFNGNKIITTSGGGMLTTEDADLAALARNLSQQARDPAPHYEHSRIGYNYRLSNLLAAVGLAQLAVLDDRVAARRRINAHYRQALAPIAGITFPPDVPESSPNRWLTVALIDETGFGASREEIRLHLEAHRIEARPAWKPMHLQPVYRGCRVLGGPVAEGVFRDGLCLPSGSALSDSDLERIVATILDTPRRAR